jgi:hypothetical protein
MKPTPFSKFSISHPEQNELRERPISWCKFFSLRVPPLPTR